MPPVPTPSGVFTPAGGPEAWPDYPAVFPRLAAAAKGVTDVLRPRWPAGRRHRAVLCGADFICDAARRPFLLEINQCPPLEYQDPAVQAFVEELARDFVVLVVRPVLEGAAPVEGGWLRL